MKIIHFMQSSCFLLAPTRPHSLVIRRIASLARATALFCDLQFWRSFRPLDSSLLLGTVIVKLRAYAA
jgi:hypothetical protein